MNLSHKYSCQLLLLRTNGTREAQHEVAVMKWRNPDDYEDNEM